MEEGGQVTVSPWRHTCSIPRQLFLITVDDRFISRQRSEEISMANNTVTRTYLIGNSPLPKSPLVVMFSTLVSVDAVLFGGSERCVRHQNNWDA